jgi:cellobiose PTS system EIIA component
LIKEKDNVETYQSYRYINDIGKKSSDEKCEITKHHKRRVKMTAITEEIIFQIILHGGNGKSLAMEAIFAAKQGDIKVAEAKLAEAEEAISEAHRIQTGLIQGEINGNKAPISLLMIHAQDHLMTSITVKDLAKEFVDLYKSINCKLVEN